MYLFSYKCLPVSYISMKYCSCELNDGFIALRKIVMLLIIYNPKWLNGLLTKKYSESELEGACSSQTILLHMKRFNKTEFPIFILLCVLCFLRQSFRFFILLHCYLVLLNPDIPAFANSVDPDQLAEANWSGSVLFAIKYVNLYQQSGSSNLIGRKLEVGVVSFYSAGQGLSSGRTTSSRTSPW